jgi:alkylation response protein AidB-like acyl-CoA dehydrogenase
VSAPPDPEDVRREVRAFVERAWDPDLELVEWRQRLLDGGWAVPSSPPARFGRGLPAWSDEVVRQTLIAAGAVATPLGVGMALVVPTLLAHADDGLLGELLGPTLIGARRWCQLFSEPGAGSDLAGLTTAARLDGDEWTVEGQKVWTTSAREADLGLLLVRTDPEVPKHQGLTCLVLAMDQPGVTVRPLRQMNGHATFNEVFLDGARVPRRAVVGAPGEGWRAARTTLAHERRFGALRLPPYAPGPGRALAAARREAEEHAAIYRWYPQRAGRVDLALERARRGAPDPVTRDELSRLVALQRTGQWTAARAAGARNVGPGGSLGKLAMSHVARRAADVHGRLGGAAALLSGPDAPDGGVVSEILISVPAQSIAGGTDEVQRNIVAERVLGLPKDLSPDPRLAFKDLPRNA